MNEVRNTRITRPLASRLARSAGTNMGRVHVEHPNGDEQSAATIECADCHTPWSNEQRILSNSFQSASGRAYLFSHAVNLYFGRAKLQQMITGVYFVRDLFCKKCHVKVGWVYELAFSGEQRWKEGLVVIECCRFQVEPPIASAPKAWREEGCPLKQLGSPFASPSASSSDEPEVANEVHLVDWNVDGMPALPQHIDDVDMDQL